LARKRRAKGELTKLGEQLDKLVAQYVKKRDKFRCQWCGSPDHLQASHIIPKREGLVCRWNTENVITLCLRCHLETWHKNPLWAAEWFHEKYPGKYRILKKLLRVHKVYTADERRQMIAELRDKIARL